MESVISIEFGDQSRKGHFSNKIQVDLELNQCKISQLYQQISALNIRKVLNRGSNTGKAATNRITLVIQGIVAFHYRQKRK